MDTYNPDRWYVLSKSGTTGSVVEKMLTKFPAQYTPFVALYRDRNLGSLSALTKHEEANHSGAQSFFGALGCAMATTLCCLGASYGTAKSSGAVFSAAILRPESWTRNMYAVVEPHAGLFISGLLALCNEMLTVHG